jgi:glycosyltransferase involved in cell wall biosynthesis
MKILIVSEMSVPYAVGGGEVRYALLARELVRRGHDVTWLSMRQRESPDEEMIDGVRHLHRGPRITNPPSRPLFAMVRFMVTAFVHILTHRYDIVDTQTYAPLPPVWLACLLSRQKMVATIHDTSAGGAGSAGDDQWLSARDRWIVRPIEKLLYRLPYRRIVTDTEAVKAVLADRFGVNPRRMVPVACGIDIDAIAAAPAAAERADVVFVGRLVPHKHVEDFLQAVAAVGERRVARGRSALTAAVIGSGPLSSEMRSLAASLGVLAAPGDPEPRFGASPSTAVVEFTGPLTDHAAVIGRIKSAGVLVLPSTREGFGLVLAEAMACGKPCVAYDVPAVRETLANGEAGVLVPCRDVEGLVAAIESLLADDALRESLVAVGSRWVVGNFAAGRFAERMVAVYADDPRSSCSHASISSEASGG